MSSRNLVTLRILPNQVSTIRRDPVSPPRSFEISSNPTAPCRRTLILSSECRPLRQPPRQHIRSFTAAHHPRLSLSSSSRPSRQQQQQPADQLIPPSKDVLTQLQISAGHDRHVITSEVATLLGLHQHDHHLNEDDKTACDLMTTTRATQQTMTTTTIEPRGSSPAKSAVDAAPADAAAIAPASTSPTPLPCDEVEASSSSSSSPRWELVMNGLAIEREFVFASFKKTWAFMTSVAHEAQARRHHPTWTNTYNRTHVRWTTHDPRGLSALDTHMARFCDAEAKKFGERI